MWHLPRASPRRSAGFHDEEDAVVFVDAAAGVGFHFVEDEAHDFLGGLSAVFFYEFGEAGLAEFVSGGVHGFGDAVGAGDHEVAGLHGDHSAVKLRVREQADDHAAFLEVLDAAIGADDGGRDVAGVDVAKLLAFVFDEGEEHAEIFGGAGGGSGAGDAEKFVVDGGGQFLEGIDVVGESVEGGLDVGHHQRGSGAFALDVGNNDQQGVHLFAT